MHRPRKRFGQHFLEDPGTIGDIVAAVAPAADDRLVEIGPGRGAITAKLADRAEHLHAIEFGRDLVKLLRERYTGRNDITVHEADALDFDYGALGDGLRVVGNLPYNISTPLLFRLIEQRRHLKDLHFMLQKEVVDRMAASPGGKTYGRLTIMLGCYMRVEPLFDVPPQAFAPRPAIMSSLVRLTPLASGHYRIDDPELLAEIVSRAFSMRRKTIRNALRTLAGDADLTAAGIDPATRAERIPVGAWIGLANSLRSR